MVSSGPPSVIFPPVDSQVFTFFTSHNPLFHCSNTNLAPCVLPACSHLFGERCMRANVWRSHPPKFLTDPLSKWNFWKLHFFFDFFPWKFPSPEPVTCLDSPSTCVYIWCLSKFVGGTNPPPPPPTGSSNALCASDPVPCGVSVYSWYVKFHGPMFNKKITLVPISPSLPKKINHFLILFVWVWIP